jgi:hypothetical protein
MSEELELINNAKASIQKIVFKDGTEYFRMPNGNLVRATPRSYKIRKKNKLINNKK